MVVIDILNSCKNKLFVKLQRIQFFHKNFDELTLEYNSLDKENTSNPPDWEMVQRLVSAKRFSDTDISWTIFRNRETYQKQIR